MDMGGPDGCADGQAGPGGCWAAGWADGHAGPADCGGAGWADGQGAAEGCWGAAEGQGGVCACAATAQQVTAASVSGSTRVITRVTTRAGFMGVISRSGTDPDD